MFIREKDEINGKDYSAGALQDYTYHCQIRILFPVCGKKELRLLGLYVASDKQCQSMVSKVNVKAVNLSNERVDCSFNSRCKQSKTL